MMKLVLEIDSSGNTLAWAVRAAGTALVSGTAGSPEFARATAEAWLRATETAGDSDIAAVEVVDVTPLHPVDRGGLT